MGSFRRGLTYSFCLIASPGWAEVCDKERPYWSPSDGPASAFTELYNFVLNPLVLGLMALSIFAMATGRRRFLLPIAALWLLVLLVLLMPYEMDDVHYAAIKEGCIGPRHLSIAVSAAICVVMIFTSMQNKRREA